MPFESNTELSKDGSATIYIVDRNSINGAGKFDSENFERFLVFATGVKHKDLVLWDFFLLLIGMVGGGIFGCLAAVFAPLILAHFFGLGSIGTGK